MAVPTNLAEALALLTAAGANRITPLDVREVVEWLESLSVDAAALAEAASAAAAAASTAAAAAAADAAEAIEAAAEAGEYDGSVINADGVSDPLLGDRFGSASTYLSLLLGSTTDGQQFVDAVGYAVACMAFARRSAAPGEAPTLAPWCALGGDDSGTQRTLYYGGGGFTMPGATQHKWFVDSYTEIEDDGFIALHITDVGNVSVGPVLATTTGRFQVHSVSANGVAISQSTVAGFNWLAGRTMCGKAANVDSGIRFQTGGAGGVKFAADAATSGQSVNFVYVAPAHTGQAGNEQIDVDWQTTGTLERVFSATLTNQRTMRIQARTYSFLGASVLTNAATLAIEGAPIAGALCTMTRSSALWVQAGETRLDGALALTNDANLTLANGNNNNHVLGADVACLRIDTAAGGVLTGLTGGVDGRVVVLHNVDAADSFTITHDDAASASNNRFYLPGGVTRTMVIHDGMTVRYDATSSRWRVAT